MLQNTNVCNSETGVLEAFLYCREMALLSSCGKIYRDATVYMTVSSVAVLLMACEHPRGENNLLSLLCTTRVQMEDKTCMSCLQL